MLIDWLNLYYNTLLEVSSSSQRWQQALAIGKCRYKSALEFLGVLLIFQYCCCHRDLLYQIRFHSFSSLLEYQYDGWGCSSHFVAMR